MNYWWTLDKSGGELKSIQKIPSLVVSRYKPPYENGWGHLFVTAPDEIGAYAEWIKWKEGKDALDIDAGTSNTKGKDDATV